MAGNEGDIPPPQPPGYDPFEAGRYEPFPNGRPDPLSPDWMAQQAGLARAHNRWIHFKGHFATVVSTALGTGIVLLLGAGIISSFMGDYKREQLETDLRQEMTDRHNSTVIREGRIVAELMAKLSKRDKKIKELEMVITELETDIGLAHPDPAPLRAITPTQQASPNMPAQQRLDWNEKYRETYKKK